jgi:pimeloyl-ACP methyl ester carboxylesterase
MGERFLRANGLRFRYLDWEGDGPDLIFVHPTGFVADIWMPFAERIRVRFRCIALDTRGHGDSDKPGDYQPIRLAEDLLAFIDAAGLDHPTGIGHSAGATAIARAEADRPGSFRAAVLMEPIVSYDLQPGEDVPEVERLVTATLKRRAVWSSRQEAYDSYRARPPFQTWDDEILRQYVEHGFADRPDGGVELKCPPESEASMYSAGLPRLLSEELLRRVRCPALLLRSEESPVFTQVIAERTAALLPDCRVSALPGGHFAPFEHPRLAEGEIQRFLDVLDAERPASATSQRRAMDGGR